jgi:transcriptional regulator with XRE-family HTH domain
MIEGPQALIHKLRLQRGWSQEQLAELTGLSVRTIQRIERGQSASVESLKCLAAVFDVDFATLREPDMNTSMPAVAADEALALAYARKIKGFYIHLALYCIVIVVLAVVNALTYPSRLWVLWVAFGWGMGVLVQGLRVFNKVPFLNAAWERRQVEKYLGRKL